MSRSRAHMFMVAAARLEQDSANAKLVEDLRAQAKRESQRYAEGMGRGLDENTRIERQRTLMTMVPDSRAKDALVDAMLQRAYDLMWDGMCLECDALAEFLPSAMVQRMFEAWESDQMNRDEPSKFYGKKR